MKNKKKQTIGHINPNAIKTRDIVHMQEFLHGAGGAHKTRKADHRREARRQERDGPDSLA